MKPYILLYLFFAIFICSFFSKISANQNQQKSKNVRVSLNSKFSLQSLVYEASEFFSDFSRLNVYKSNANKDIDEDQDQDNFTNDYFQQFIEFIIKQKRNISNAKIISDFEQFEQARRMITERLGLDEVSSQAAINILELSLSIHQYSVKIEMYDQLLRDMINQTVFQNQSSCFKNKNLTYMKDENFFLVYDTFKEEFLCGDIENLDEVLVRRIDQNLEDVLNSSVVPKTLENSKFNKRKKLFLPLNIEHQYPTLSYNSEFRLSEFMQIIYFGDFLSPVFGKVHEKLSEYSKNYPENFGYILRPKPSHEAIKVLQLQANNLDMLYEFQEPKDYFNLQGYGIELALKNTEYKAMDDSNLSHKYSETELSNSNTTSANNLDNVFDPEEEVQGFNFSRLVKRWPELYQELVSFRDLLVSSLEDDDSQVQIWDMNNLGLQSVQRIMNSRDQLKLLSDTAGDFPIYGRSLTKVKLNQSIRSDVKTLHKKIAQGTNMVLLNGISIDSENSPLDIYSLQNLLLQETIVIGKMKALNLSLDTIHKLLHLETKNAEYDSASDIQDQGEVETEREENFSENWDYQDINSKINAFKLKSFPYQIDMRVNKKVVSDFKSLPLLWLNDLERDSRYSSWESSFDQLLAPRWPGQLVFLSRNINNVVMILNMLGSLNDVLQNLKLSLDNILSNYPIRYATVFYFGDGKNLLQILSEENFDIVGDKRTELLPLKIAQTIRFLIDNRIGLDCVKVFVNSLLEHAQNALTTKTFYRACKTMLKSKSSQKLRSGNFNIGKDVDELMRVLFKNFAKSAPSHIIESEKYVNDRGLKIFFKSRSRDCLALVNGKLMLLSNDNNAFEDFESDSNSGFNSADLLNRQILSNVVQNQNTFTYDRYYGRLMDSTNIDRFLYSNSRVLPTFSLALKQPKSYLNRFDQCLTFLQKVSDDETFSPLHQISVDFKNEAKGSSTKKSLVPCRSISTIVFADFTKIGGFNAQKSSLQFLKILIENKEFDKVRELTRIAFVQVFEDGKILRGFEDNPKDNDITIEKAKDVLPSIINRYSEVLSKQVSVSKTQNLKQIRSLINEMIEFGNFVSREIFSSTTRSDNENFEELFFEFVKKNLNGSFAFNNSNIENISDLRNILFLDSQPQLIEYSMVKRLDRNILLCESCFGDGLFDLNSSDDVLIMVNGKISLQRFGSNSNDGKKIDEKVVDETSIQASDILALVYRDYLQYKNTICKELFIDKNFGEENFDSDYKSDISHRLTYFLDKRRHDLSKEGFEFKLFPTFTNEKIGKRVESNRILYQSQSSSFFQINAIIDPISLNSQRISSILLQLRDAFDLNINLYLNPTLNLQHLPIKRFYRYVFTPKLSFDKKTGQIKAVDVYQANFRNLFRNKVLTMGVVDIPESWLVQSKYAVYDLDNILLKDLPAGMQNLIVEYELQHLLVSGQCMDYGASKNNDDDTKSSEGSTQAKAASGLQLILGTNSISHIYDTIVMKNLGYFQFKADPGVQQIDIAEGSGRNLFYIENSERNISSKYKEKQFLGNRFRSIVYKFSDKMLKLKVKRRSGMESIDLLTYSFSPSTVSSKSKPTQVTHKKVNKKNLWNRFFLSSNKTKGNLDSVEGEDSETIHIMSVASGHLYERFLKIMMLSVINNTKSPVKFQFFEQFLSPQFKKFVPEFAKHYGFQVELMAYKQPFQLHKETEKQRLIWGYKILFLDVLFPLKLKRIIFVDADQIVRADLKELWTMDLKGAPYAYTPFCDSNKDTKGFRFWDTGYWKSHLNGRPYHISALYVVDLQKFRQKRTGDTLRVYYQQLSQDKNSLANLDQDLPNYLQMEVEIFSLPQDWLWCETWCSMESLSKAKTIDLCNNPQTKEPKLEKAKRLLPEQIKYDEEARNFTEYILFSLNKSNTTLESAQQANQHVKKSLDNVVDDSITKEEL